MSVGRVRRANVVVGMSECECRVFVCRINLLVHCRVSDCDRRRKRIEGRT